MQLFSKEDQCCGCTACQSICPKNAVSMQTDGKGFLYPHVNVALCVNCGLCKLVCPMDHQQEKAATDMVTPEFYAVKHRFDEVRMKSSSGGAFTAVSDWILEQGGAVYGAAFDGAFRVCHQRAVTKKERDGFCGSKYVQSDLENTFVRIREDLVSGMPVLFSGMPCQADGLRRFLAHSGINSDSLYLCDLICHGAPSQQLWTDYRVFLTKRYHSKIRSYSFRDKKSGWRGYQISVAFQNGVVVRDQWDVQSYVSLFGSDIDLRPSCYRCPFANLHRKTDLTIGDFWGIEKSIPEFEDEKGVSLVLVHTQKGKRLFQSVEGKLETHSLRPEQGMQWNLEKPSVPSLQMDAFWEDYKKRGFEFVANRYAEGGLKGKIKCGTKKALKQLGLFGAAKGIFRRG